MTPAVALDPLLQAEEMFPEMPENAAANDKRERYFFFAGDEPGMDAPGGMRVQSPCVPNSMIRRGQVTPLRTVPVTRRLAEIPEGSLIYGTADDATGLGRMDLNAGPEGAELLQMYGNGGDSARQWGLVELAPTLLRGKPLREMAQLRITHIFFPDWPEMPAQNHEVRTMIEEARDQLANNSHPGFKFVKGNYQSEQAKEIYLSVADDMLRAVEQAQRHQEDILAVTNLAVTLPSTEPGYKRDYDPRDRLFSERTGIALSGNSLRRGVEQQSAPQVQREPSMNAQEITDLVTGILKGMTQQTQAEPAMTVPVVPPMPTKKAA